MAKNFDLTSPQWLEMVFKGKNREYGAYVMRRNSSNRHLQAMVIMSLLVAAMMFLPGLIRSDASATESDDLGRKERVVLGNYENKREEVKPVEPLPAPKELPTKAVIKFTPPVIAPDEVLKPAELMETQKNLSESGLGISTVNNPDGVEKGGIDPDEVIIIEEIVKKEETPTVLPRAEQMPQFPGGEEALYRWLAENLVYPTIAAERGTQGTITLRFVVTDTGSIGEVQILKGVDRDLDKEALRAVGKLPKFIPGRQNGQTVSVWFTLPVKFKLN